MRRWWKLRLPAVSVFRRESSYPHHLLSQSIHPQSYYSRRNDQFLHSTINPILRSSHTPSLLLLGSIHDSPSELRFPSSVSPFMMVHAKGFSSKERKRTKGTPVTSKVKKIKMKSYSSYKMRFRVMKDGAIRRWRAGKRHNAHLKSKKSKQRLRQPALVHAAYATTMKKLNFCA